MRLHVGQQRRSLDCASITSENSNIVFYFLFVGATLGGSDLYSHLIRYFQKHLEVIRKDSENFMDVSLLEYYTKQWVKFTQASTYVHHLFTYLNRHWVKREIDEGRKTVHDVGTVSHSG